MLLRPKLFAAISDVGAQVLRALSPRELELAVLRVHWLCQSAYGWGEHVLVARKLGFTGEEIERITLGAAAPGWNEHERALLSAVEELRETAQVSDQTWHLLAQRFDAGQLVELLAVIGQAQAMAYFLNGTRLKPVQGNLGLDAR